MDIPSNSTECFCSDLQEDDYSPTYAWFNYIVIICSLPWLSLFGLITNVMNVFIFSRTRMLNSSNTYLFSLACSDILVILTGLFIFWIDSARTYIQELADAPYLIVYALPLGYMAQSCSIYFTVAAAVDCYVAVCCKKQSKNYCTVRRARQVCGTITIVSMMYNSMRFPQFNLRTCLPEGSTDFVVEICPTSLYFTVNTIYNVYMYMVLMTLTPFFFLLVLNVFIVVRQSMDEKNKSLRSSFRLKATPPPEARLPTAEEKNATDDTITMIMVVVLFLCCNTLALIVNIIETFFETGTTVIHTLSDASNFLVVFNSSVNCVIYYIFNAEYRELFNEHILSRMRCEKNGYRRRSMPSLIYHDDADKPERNGKATNGASRMSYSSIGRPTEPTYTTPAEPALRPINWPPTFVPPNWPQDALALAPTPIQPDARSPSLSYAPPTDSDIQLADEEDSGWGDEGTTGTTIISMEPATATVQRRQNPVNEGAKGLEAEVRLDEDNKPSTVVRQDVDGTTIPRTKFTVTAL